MTAVARSTVALTLVLVVLAAGLCLVDATGQHADDVTICCVILVTLSVAVPLALGTSGRLVPLAAGGLPGLSLELVAPPPRA